MTIRCRVCLWKPNAWSRWQCVPSCGHAWNTFDTHGRCPACGKHWLHTCCLSCHQWSLHEAWYVEDLTEHDEARTSRDDAVSVESEAEAVEAVTELQNRLSPKGRRCVRLLRCPPHPDDPPGRKQTIIKALAAAIKDLPQQDLENLYESVEEKTDENGGPSGITTVFRLEADRRTGRIGDWDLTYNSGNDKVHIWVAGAD